MDLHGNWHRREEEGNVSQRDTRRNHLTLVLTLLPTNPPPDYIKTSELYTIHDELLEFMKAFGRYSKSMPSFPGREE